MSLPLKLLNFAQLRDATSRTECFAVQARSRASEVENPLQLPAVQDAVREAGVKKVTGAGGVGDADFVGGRIPEAVAIPGEGAVDPKRCANGAAAVSSFEERKGFEEIALSGSGAGQIPGDDRIIDEGEQLGELRSPVIEIGDDGDILRAGPGCCFTGGYWIVAVNVQKTCGGHPSFLEKRGGDGEAGVAAPNDRAFAGLSFYENEGHLTERFGCAREMEGDAFAPKIATMEFGHVIVADAADVMSAQSPALAGDDRGGDLAAEHDLRVESFDL